MNWLALAMAMVAVASPAMYVQSQCFTEDDRFNVVLDTDLSTITDFGLDLFRELLPKGSRENLFFSPYSIWSALSLTYFGTRGNTEREIQAALRVTDKIGALRLWKALDITYMLRSLVGANYTFNLANRIYVDKELPIRTCITGMLGNEVRSIDFLRVADAVNEINGFVSDTTSGKINDLLNVQDVDGAVMVIVNAAYFKGTWQNPFEPGKTHPKDFTNNQITGKVDMMHLRKKLKHGSSESLGGHLVELPYIGDVVSMYVMMPFKAGDYEFYKLVDGLNGSSLREAMSNMTLKEVDLQLPKFTLETTLTEELSQALENIGVIDLFNRTTANLTGFVADANLRVDKSITQAVIEVAEDGSEAAAATAFVINTRVAITKQKKALEFHCNRPFVFYLYDNDTNNILFMGAFRSP